MAGTTPIITMDVKPEMSDLEKIGYAIETLKVLCDISKVNATIRYDHRMKFFQVRLRSKIFTGVDPLMALQKAIVYGAQAEGYIEKK